MKYLLLNVGGFHNGEACWWLPHGQGYTSDVRRAGRWEKDTALEMQYLQEEGVVQYGDVLAIEESEVLASNLRLVCSETIMREAWAFQKKEGA